MTYNPLTHVYVYVLSQPISFTFKICVLNYTIFPIAQFLIKHVLYYMQLLVNCIPVFLYVFRVIYVILIMIKNIITASVLVKQWCTPVLICSWAPSGKLENAVMSSPVVHIHNDPCVRNEKTEYLFYILECVITLRIKCVTLSQKQFEWRINFPFAWSLLSYLSVDWMILFILWYVMAFTIVIIKLIVNYTISIRLTSCMYLINY